MGVKAGYKKTEVGVIPDDWDAVQLDELFTFKNGLNKAKQFFGYGTPIVNYMDVFGKSALNIHNIVGRVDVNSRELKAYEVRRGDVFFTRTSETVDEIGVASVMLDDANQTVFSGFVLRARPRDNSLHDRFKAYCFSEGYFRGQVRARASYTTRALTNGKSLSAAFLVRPPLPEQQAIANALSDVDQLIASLDQLIAKKRDLKQAAMQQLLTGKTRLQGFSGEWEAKRLGDVADILKGQLITKEMVISGEVPVIAGGKRPAYYHSRANRYGSTITVSGSGASAGYVAIHRKPIFASDCCTISEGAGYVLDFIFYFLQLKQSEIYRSQTGGAQPHIHPKDLRPLMVTIPNELTEQEAIASILSDMDQELTELEQRRDKTTALKQGMMQELLTGRTRLV